ncbi:hypothetical protein K443DRAFT_134976 [Laccaria amethystina LaAM-08-1]|uniref:Uncharacterized protein n=1 Tax=Laccaria amethystina LaAM-08-1 TaxID=1095629 RepID=A0A0C9XBN7_9AGAR|nr:hypothetical protein K443DRAFT_134976 [Laccaria amethystina LaAM-08-1]
MANDGVLPPNIASNTNAICVLAVHPRIALKGKISPRTIIERKCPTRMVIYIPIDTSIQKAIIILRNPHNHPMYPKTKPSTEEKDRLRRAITAAGNPTCYLPSKYSAPSASAIYSSTALPVATPAYMDRHKLRDEIRREKMKDHPKGLGWEVKGDVDEWEIVGFLDRFKRRVTLACFYCDRNTRNAFGRLFSELFRIIPELTGFILKFFAFFPGDPQALLRAIILDTEAPQAQGLGDELLVYVAKYVPEATLTVPRHALDLLMVVLKTCCIHFERFVLHFSPTLRLHSHSYYRNIDKLPATVPRETIIHLKGFMGLQSDREIQEWHEFCRNSPEKSVRDWHQQKINNPWLLPSLNAFLSKMDRTSWNLMPNHSNLVEGGHSGTNNVTSIGKEIGEAITSARELDDKIADELEAMERNDVLPKRWNGPSEREHLNTQRRAWSHAKQKDRDDKLARHDEFTAELQALSSQQAESMKLDKFLQTQIKTLRDNQDSDWKEKIKAVQQEVEAEKEKRRGFKSQRQLINQSIQELKDNGLSGARVNGRRSTLSAGRSAAEHELYDVLGNDMGELSKSPMVIRSPGGHLKGGGMSIQVDLFADMPVTYSNDHHPFDSADTTLHSQSPAYSVAFQENSGFDVNFNFDGFNFTPMDYFDLGNADTNSLEFNNLNVNTTFNYEQAFMEAALSVGMDKNRTDSDSSPLVLSPYPPQPDDANTVVSTGSSPGRYSPIATSTNSPLIVPTPPGPNNTPAHRRPTKRKKANEVNEAHILPEGLQRSRTMSAKAAAALKGT